MATFTRKLTINFNDNKFQVSQKMITHVGDVDYLTVEPYGYKLMRLLIGAKCKDLINTDERYSFAGHPAYEALINARSDEQANSLIDNPDSVATPQADALARLFGADNVAKAKPPKKRVRNNAAAIESMTLVIDGFALKVARPLQLRDALRVELTEHNITALLTYLSKHITSIDDVRGNGTYSWSGMYSKADKKESMDRPNEEPSSDEPLADASEGAPHGGH